MQFLCKPSLSFVMVSILGLRQAIPIMTCCSANGALNDYNFQLKYFSHDLCLTNGKILCPKKALNNKKGINLLSYNSYFSVLNPCSFVA